MRKFLLLLTVVLMLPAAQLRASDFGLILTQAVNTDVVFSENPAIMTSTLATPWFQSRLKDYGEVYLSAGGGLLYENSTLKFLGELLRFEAAVRNSRGTEFEFGRMPYSDPLGLIAAGLFDGVKVSQKVGKGTLSIGSWYTGLLYRKSANITISPEDNAEYYADLDIHTYFSSRRILTAIGYENSTLAEEMWLKLAFIGQFDVNGRGDKYHSEFLTGKVIVPFKSTFFFNAGGAVELLQIPDTEARVALLGEASASWVTPLPFNNRLSFTTRYATGKIKDSPLGGFSPLSTVAQGGVLKAKMSGLTVVKLDYLVRAHETLSMDLAFSYFIKAVNDGYAGWPETGTVYEPVNNQKNRYTLGGEVFFSLNWVPTSDIQLKINNGVFIPAMGNVAPDERPRMLFNIAASIAVY